MTDRRSPAEIREDLAKAKGLLRKEAQKPQRPPVEVREDLKKGR